MGRNRYGMQLPEFTEYTTRVPYINDGKITTVISGNKLLQLIVINCIIIKIL